MRRNAPRSIEQAGHLAYPSLPLGMKERMKAPARAERGVELRERTLSYLAYPSPLLGMRERVKAPARAERGVELRERTLSYLAQRGISCG